MKPAESVIDVESNIVGQEVKLSFDENSTAHLMRILTDLYSDPIKAIVREYSTNALDSHREAGVDGPIRVELPSYMSPVFKVIDYGVGLSKDEIVEVYSKYGASTKRDTNEQTGMLGLGCKSALSYTTQFTISGVKDGREVVVSASRNAEGSGSMTLVTDRETDKGNGVEITVPVSTNDIERFAAAAQEFFCTWEPEQVTVIGADVPFLSDEKNHWMSDDVCVAPYSKDNAYSYRHSKAYIVQGGVAYPVERYRWSFYPNKADVFVYMDIGTIDFTPSREELHYTPRTLAAVEEASKKFASARFKWVKESLESAQTKDELVKAYYAAVELNVKLPNDDATRAITFKGRSVIEKYYKASGNHFFRPVNSIRDSDSYRGTVPHILDAVWVTGFKGKRYTSTQHNKINHYLLQKDINVEFVNVVDDLPKEHLGSWEKEIVTLKWEDIPAIPRNPLTGSGTVSVRPAGTYIVVDTESTRETLKTAEDILYDLRGTSSPVIVYEGNKHDLHEVTGKYMGSPSQIPTVVQVPKSKMARFRRECDGERKVVHFKDALKKWSEKELQKAIDRDFAEKLALSEHYWSKHGFVHVPAEVTDPQLAKWKKLHTDLYASDKALRDIRHYRRLISQNPENKLWPLVQKAVNELQEVYEKYPLLGSSLLRGNQHFPEEHFPEEHRLLYFDAIHNHATKEDG